MRVQESTDEVVSRIIGFRRAILGAGSLPISGGNDQ
jgi:uncharacterized protein YlzI (FlbEa/FlbD family)